jgi:hypothetical protein
VFVGVCNVMVLEWIWVLVGPFLVLFQWYTPKLRLSRALHELHTGRLETRKDRH